MQKLKKSRNFTYRKGKARHTFWREWKKNVFINKQS